MEGEGEIPLPEGGGGGSMTKIIAAIVVIIIVVAAIAGALLLMGGETENEEPTAQATASSSVIVAGQSVNFDGTGSVDPDEDTLTYAWNFGDGETDSETGAIVSHTYHRT
jgi:PKD repeat protein